MQQALKKSGYYAEAIDEWEKAYSYARGENVSWCQARINRCKKQEDYLPDNTKKTILLCYP